MCMCAAGEQVQWCSKHAAAAPGTGQCPAPGQCPRWCGGRRSRCRPPPPHCTVVISKHAPKSVQRQSTMVSSRLSKHTPSDLQPPAFVGSARRDACRAFLLHPAAIRDAKAAPRNRLCTCYPARSNASRDIKQAVRRQLVHHVVEERDLQTSMGNVTQTNDPN